MNHMYEVCNLLGLKPFEKFNIVDKHPHQSISAQIGKSRNPPYYFTDEGILNNFYVKENDLLPDLIVGSFEIIKIN